MKTKLFLFVILFFSVSSSFSQTLYVPGGTGGIGNTSTSNVGIGISSPSEKLHINGSIRGNINGALRISTGSGYIELGPQNTTFAHINTDRSGFLFNKPIYLNSTNTLICNVSNKINFTANGTLSLILDDYVRPQKWLVMNDGKWFYIGSENVDEPRLGFTHNQAHAYIDFKDNLYFRADKSWLCPLALYGNNSVGIGFTPSGTAGDFRNQGYKLAVNGGILCEEVKVIEDVPDADFVFEKEYKLMPLEELEAYVNEHKHLPDIQSADEFKENGYKLGDMDTKLLQKVEELTLYVIELQKQNMALKAEVDSLKGN